jgi:hypothetical protein
MVNMENSTLHGFTAMKKRRRRIKKKEMNWFTQL